ncbi:hypothetical protein ACFX13_014004 [Malus domestica]
MAAFGTWDGTGQNGTRRSVPCLPPFPVTSLPSLSPVASSSTTNPTTQMLCYPNVASFPSNPDEFELDFGLSGLSRRRIRRNTGETDRNALPSREKLGVCAGRNDTAFAKCREIIV